MGVLIGPFSFLSQHLPVGIHVALNECGAADLSWLVMTTLVLGVT